MQQIPFFALAATVAFLSFSGGDGNKPPALTALSKPVHGPTYEELRVPASERGEETGAEENRGVATSLRRFSVRHVPLNSGGIPGPKALAVEVSHGLGSEDPESFRIGSGATFTGNLASIVRGFVTSEKFESGEVLLHASAETVANPVIRIFAMAVPAVEEQRKADQTHVDPDAETTSGPATGNPAQLDTTDKGAFENARTEGAAVRQASAYAMTGRGARLDAYYVLDAGVASELLPSGDGLSIAGGGDRPRRFMRGHRFEAGSGMVASIRYADPRGGSLRISVGLPSAKNATYSFPSKEVSLAVTELAPDLSFGRVMERAAGTVRFETRGAGSGRLHLDLDITLRTVGVRDPQRLIVAGVFTCVPVSLAELTPWLGSFRKGRPVLEEFAFPVIIKHDPRKNNGPNY